MAELNGPIELPDDSGQPINGGTEPSAVQSGQSEAPAAVDPPAESLPEDAAVALLSLLTQAFAPRLEQAATELDPVQAGHLIGLLERLSRLDSPAGASQAGPLAGELEALLSAPAAAEASVPAPATAPEAILPTVENHAAPTLDPLSATAQSRTAGTAQAPTLSPEASATPDPLARLALLLRQLAGAHEQGSPASMVEPAAADGIPAQEQPVALASGLAQAARAVRGLLEAAVAPVSNDQDHAVAMDSAPSPAGDQAQRLPALERLAAVLAAPDSGAPAMAAPVPERTMPVAGTIPSATIPAAASGQPETPVPLGSAQSQPAVAVVPAAPAAEETSQAGAANHDRSESRAAVLDGAETADEPVSEVLRRQDARERETAAREGGETRKITLPVQLGPVAAGGRRPGELLSRQQRAAVEYVRQSEREAPARENASRPAQLFRNQEAPVSSSGGPAEELARLVAAAGLEAQDSEPGRGADNTARRAEGITAGTRAESPARSIPAQPNLLPRGPWLANEAEVLQKLGSAARLTQQGGTSEISLRLEPDHLGLMRVRLTVDDHQGLSARIQVETQEARTLIENSLHRLRESLAEQGLRVEKFSVDVRQDQHGDQHGQQQAQPGGRDGGYRSRDREPGGAPDGGQEGAAGSASTEDSPAAERSRNPLHGYSSLEWVA